MHRGLLGCCFASRCAMDPMLAVCLLRDDWHPENGLSHGDDFGVQLVRFVDLQIVAACEKNAAL
jgi:hypothetical protein